MAAIRMSNRLKSEIMSNIRQLFEKRKKDLGQAIIDLNTDVQYQKFLYEHFHFDTSQNGEVQKLVLENPWMASCFFIPKKIKFDMKFNISEAQVFDWNSDKTKNVGQWLCNPEWKEQYSYDNCAIIPIKIKIDPKNLGEFKGLHVNLDKTIDLLVSLNSIAEEMRILTSKASKILSSTNSLKQFLEAWPQGQLLVPDEDLEKLQKKQSMQSKVLQDAGITDQELVEMNAALLKAKIIKQD